MEIKHLLQSARSQLNQLYGPRLRGVVLYGSEARREARPESDIDLLVLLDGPVDTYKELLRITRALYPLQMDACDRAIAALPVDFARYQSGEFQLYRTAKKEGIAL